MNAISKYKGGSGVVLPNPHDEDIFLYFNTNDERKHALITNHDHSKDFHFKLKDKALNIFLGCYAYPYMELIEGEDLGLKDFDIKEHSKEYANCLIEYINRWKDKDLTNKHWYHVYLGYCALKNKTKLTKTQKEKAQTIHDSGIDSELLKDIFDYLTILVNN